MSCNALTCIQNSKKNKNKNKNKNKMLTKTKKIKLKQVIFKFIVNLDLTNLKNSFAKFYNFATKSLRDSKLLTRSLNNNIISFFFTFVRALFAYTSIENKERENAYK